MIAVNQTRDAVLAECVLEAATFFTRLRGLMFRSELGAREGMHIDSCNSVHTCFMRFAIDVAFLDSERNVAAVIDSMKPWRFSKLHKSSREVLELPAGTIKRTGTVVGDRILLQESR